MLLIMIYAGTLMTSFVCANMHGAGSKHTNQLEPELDGSIGCAGDKATLMCFHST